MGIDRWASAFWVTGFENSKWQVSQGWLLGKPCSEQLVILWGIKTFTGCSLITFTLSFGKAKVWQMGRTFSGSCKEPFLWCVATTEAFHFVAQGPEIKNRFRRNIKDPGYQCEAELLGYHQAPALGWLEIFLHCHDTTNVEWVGGWRNRSQHGMDLMVRQIAFSEEMMYMYWVFPWCLQGTLCLKVWKSWSSEVPTSRAANELWKSGKYFKLRKGIEVLAFIALRTLVQLN